MSLELSRKMYGRYGYGQLILLRVYLKLRKWIRSLREKMQKEISRRLLVENINIFGVNGF